MNLFNSILNESKEYNLLKQYLTENINPIHISGALESQKSHIVNSLAQDFNAPSLIICENEEKAKLFCEDLKFFQKNNVYHYPAKDIIFYSANVKSLEIVKARLNIIKNLLSSKKITVVLSIDALLDRMVKREIFEKFIIHLNVGDTLNIDNLLNTLLLIGYERSETVEGQGQFAIRGGIIDIFSPIVENAFRIELWGDEIDSIRLLDSFSQRSIENTKKAIIYPMRELVYENSDITFATKNMENELNKTVKLYENNNNLTEATHLKENIQNILEKLKHNKTFSGIDKYIQFFYSENTSLLDYFEPNTIIYFNEPNKISEKADFIKNDFFESIKGRILKGEILPCQSKMILDYSEIINSLAKFPQILLSNIMSSKKDFILPKDSINFNVKSSSFLKNNLTALYDELYYYKKREYKIIFICNGKTKCERFNNEFNEKGLTSIFLTEEKINNTEYDLKNGIIYIIRGSLNKGFEYPNEKFILIADKEIFGEEKTIRKPSKKKKTSRLQSFTDLKVGDYVVHENHGIAVFKGIEKIVTDNISKDYLKLGFADEGVLYISVNQLDMLQKYISGGSNAPKVSKLGGKQWNIAKSKAKKAVSELAKDLLILYAKRQKSEGFYYSKDTVWQTEFEDNFPFQETQDQLDAIIDVKNDMESSRVMDRLICGDVGFGKTEVAIRGAFKAVQDGKQVVFLVPTTILAQQHFQTFSKRMKDYPINIDLLSRFRTPKQQKHTLVGIEKGIVDILIGTHRVLSKDINFKDLGLIIIDEEQRFGVKHKEKLKNLKENTDVLTLSATPIPRTLHMSMTGIRDMSILEEPPKERMPVQTYVLEYDEESIKNAIKRELARNGQVYYLHNRVLNIDEESIKVQNLVPDARVAFAHGQMTERELENVMNNFMEREIDVLVCTTIIETGLDISNVNTIIINNADTMGLSQLYQLRGRVGRSSRISFAYLMYKKDKVLQEISEKRLQTIKEFTEFGSGFKIAMRDLEIRGAGNLLGSQQHGHMDIIGYEMYCKLLDQAIKKLKGEILEKEFETQIDVSINAFITENYIQNEIQKLEMYKKISLIKTEEDLSDIQDELEDRFGTIPKVVHNLLNIAIMKAYAHNIGVNKIVQRENKISVFFNKENTVNLENLKEIIQNNPNLSFNGTLNYTIKESKSDFIKELKNIFSKIC